MPYDHMHEIAKLGFLSAAKRAFCSLGIIQLPELSLNDEVALSHHRVQNDNKAKDILQRKHYLSGAYLNLYGRNVWVKLFLKIEATTKLLIDYQVLLLIGPWGQNILDIIALLMPMPNMQV